MPSSPATRRAPTSPPSRMLLTFLAALLALLTVCTRFAPARAAAVGRGTLLQVQVVARHGARTPLTKTAAALREGGATLTAIGEEEHYDLGDWLRRRYASALNLTAYDNAAVHLQSSDFDRTLVSASSLALGLFPLAARTGAAAGLSPSLLPSGVTPANIPVHAKARHNDVDIRSYVNCPTLQTKLQTLYASSAFKTMETDNLALLSKLATHPAFSDYKACVSSPDHAADCRVPLTELWNVYDVINVAKTECAGGASQPGCASLPYPDVRTFLNDAEWARTVVLAHDCEVLKFGRAQTGSLIGANLLRTVLARMGHTPHQEDDERRQERERRRQRRRRRLTHGYNNLERFVLHSAHYPTLMGVFATLDLDRLNPTAGLLDGIPNYASAIIFELWDYQGTYEVVASFKEGKAQTGDPTAFTLPCEDPATGAPCSLAALVQAVNTETAKDGADTVAGWCTACGNVEADVCLLAAAGGGGAAGGEGTAKAGDGCDSGDGASGIEPNMVASAIIGAIGGGMLGVVVTVLCIRSFQKKHSGAGGRSGVRSVAMGRRHGTKRADDMEKLEDFDDEDEDEDEDEHLDDRI